MVLTRQASWVDRETGSREIAEFFGPGEMKMMGFTHLPPASASAGVVVCSPLYAELLRNYRREVLIGRLLASRGIAVQRFHYRGHGNSDGRVDDATFETMRDDAIAAARHLVETTGISRVAFFGTRLGALVAAAAARHFGAAPLALWDPVLDPSQYFRDIFRASKIQALKQGGTSRSTEDPLERLARDGSIDILGYSVTHRLYESGRGRSLIEEVGSEPRSTLVLQLGNDQRLHRGCAELVSRWQGLGFDAEGLSVGQQEAWWFTAGALVIKEELTQPVELTAGWLMRKLSAPGGTS